MDIVGASSPKDIFSFLTYLKTVVGAEIVSAYFRWETTKVYGSEKIDVELHKTENSEVFWFSVKPIEDYIFIRFPLNANGCEEIIGTIENNNLPDPSYWRWVQSAQSGTIVGGNYVPPNAKVDFIVVGYKPKAIINHLSVKA